MIIRKVIIVCDQCIRIRIGLDRCAKRIGNRKRDVGICRNKRALVHDKVLSFLIIDKPVEEIFCCLLLFRGSIFGRIDKEVLGASAHKLLVCSVTAVVGNRHHAHVLRIIIFIEHGPVPVSSEHKGNLAFCQFLLCDLTLCGNGTLFRIVVGFENIKCIHKRIELRIVSKLDGTILDSRYKGIRICLLLVNFRQEMRSQRPVLFHNAGRSCHSSCHKRVAYGFEVLSGLDRGRIKIFT